MKHTSVQQALRHAKSLVKKQEIYAAIDIYHEILRAYPNNITAQKHLKELKKATTPVKSTQAPQHTIDTLLSKFNDRRYDQVIEQSQALCNDYPQDLRLQHLIGNSNHRLGRYTEALSVFKNSLKISPNNSITFFNMGNIYLDIDHFEDAKTSFEFAIRYKSDFKEAYNNLGITLQKLGYFSEALAAYKQVMLIDPSDYYALYNMGIIYGKQRRNNDAIKSFQSALKLYPKSCECLNNLGLAFDRMGEYAKAVETFNQAISYNPSFFEAYNNLGNTYRNQGSLSKSISNFKQSISIKFDFADGHNNLGVALTTMGRLSDAHIALQKAISLDPHHAEAYNNLGICLTHKKQLTEAIAAYEKALELQPEYSEARSQKLHLQAHICDWSAIKADSSYLEDLGVSQGSISPFSVLCLEDEPQRHRLRAEKCANTKYPMKPRPFEKMSKSTFDRIKVGYFSADFNEHPVAYLIAKVLEEHDRNKFEISAYSLHTGPDSEIRKRLINSVDNFENVEELNDFEIMQKARDDEIDIAIDLTGYTQNNRTAIFAHRAAPIQINFLGYPGTLGAKFMDYIIVDHTLVPDENQKYFSEAPIYLPNSYMPTDNTRIISPRALSRKQLGLPENAFVFCCFNNNYKISEDVFDIWMRVMKLVEGSVLWLRKTNEISDKNLIKAAETRGVAASRIIFANKIPMDEHLARHKLADLFLDTFAFNAHTTASEALWAGLPVVTKVGQGFAARVAASLLNAIGLPELITHSKREYEGLILELATNKEKLEKITEKLAKNRPTKPLFDTEQYTRHLESAYHLAHQKYLSGKKPSKILIENQI